MNTQAQPAAQTNDLNVIDGEIIEVKAPDAALAVMNPVEYGRQLMEPFVKQLTAARRRAGREKYDITTKEGMATAKQLRKLFVTIRTTANEAKAEAKRPIDTAGKAILAEYKVVEDGAKAEEEKHAQAIAAEEQRLEDEKQAKIAAERARIEGIESRLAYIRGIPNTLQLADSATIQKTIDNLLAKQLEPKLYDEFLDDAAQAMIETVEALRGHLQAALVREEAARIAEANAVRLRQLEAEAAERERVAAEQARIQAEQAAAVAKQQAAMNEIMAINTLASTAATIETREQLADALAKVQAFEPEIYGAMQNMADMAKTMATTALQARLAQLPELDPYIAPAPAAVIEVVPPHVTTTGAPAMTIIHGDAPAAAEPTARYVDQDELALAPAVQRPTEAEIVAALVERFGVDKTTVVQWLFDLDHGQLALAA